MYFERLIISSGTYNNTYDTFTVFSLSELNSVVQTLKTTYPSGTSNGTLTSKVYRHNTFGSITRPCISTTSHTAVTSYQTFDPASTYSLIQYTIREADDIDSSYNGKYPPDFHYVIVKLNVVDTGGFIEAYGKWHKTGDTLPSTIQNTELVGYNTTVTNTTTSITSDCQTNDNLMTININLGKNGTLLQGSYEFTPTNLYWDYLHIHSWYAHNEVGGTGTSSISRYKFQLANDYVSRSLLKYFISIIAKDYKCIPQEWPNAP